jgi:hypothetical protein
MSTWSAVANECGTEVFVEAKLWFEARQKALVVLSQKLGRDVSQDGIHVTEMGQDFKPTSETSTGALMGSREPRP